MGKLSNTAIIIIIIIIIILSFFGKAYLGLIILLTKIVAGLISNNSVISLPIFTVPSSISSGSIISSTIPDVKVTEIYHALNYKTAPFF